MRLVLLAIALVLSALPVLPATFGTIVPLRAGAADVALDNARNRLYLVNSSLNQIEVYGLRERRFLEPIPTDRLPLSVAISRDAKSLYVACFEGSSVNVFDLDRPLESRINVTLPARPEGVAAGADGRVLISTIGSGPGNSQNVLLIYDPASATTSVSAIQIAPPAPANPVLPPPSGRLTLVSRSQLQASPDGSFIVGVNLPSATLRTVFVYEAASGTVIRSRTVGNIASVLSVSPDNSRFMSGLTLFDTRSLEVLAQQNLANAPYPFQTGANFNLQQNQGGSVFSIDGTTLYSAFNIAPTQNPPARPNVSQLMLNDPDNLLTRMGLQLPENLTGKMVLSADGANLYALSESGFVIIPIGAMNQSPIATPESGVSLLANDACGATGSQRTSTIAIRNEGRGRFTATAQVLQTTPVGPGPIGGVIGAPGGGAPGGGVIIVLPPGGLPVPGRPDLPIPIPPILPPGGVTPPTNPGVIANAPSVRTVNTGESATVELTYTPTNAGRNPGTVSPTHTFLVQSNEAINIPPAIRVFQNFRDTEARASLVSVPVGLSANEALEDMVLDTRRQRVYMANSGMNRVEVYDIGSQTLLAPIKVGQLPRSIAMSPDGGTLYVANTGGESISIVDLDKLTATGRVRFPPLPFNLNTPLVTPSLIAAGIRGPQVIMNNGSIWKIVGDEAIPRPVSSIIGQATVPLPRTLAAAPGGEYMLLMAGNGTAYLFDSLADEFIQARQIFTNPITGFYGPVAAGPRGEYFLANGTLLNQSLTPITPGGQLPGVPRPILPSRPISAVAPMSPTSYVRFAQPVRATAAAIPAELPMVEVVDLNTGLVMRSTPALEGPISTLVGNGRVNINGRTLAFDPATNTAYALTTSGLSIVPLAPPDLRDRPLINPNGVVSLSSYVPAFAPGGLLTIFGQNLANPETPSTTPLPTLLGGTCVTLNTQPLPLLMTSSGQINAQIPPDLAAGRYNLTVRSIDRKTSSGILPVTLARYAPAIFTNPATNEAALFHADGRAVGKDHPARRDERLTLYATGLGATRGGRVTTGMPSPADPLAVTDNIDVFFGDPRYKEAEMIVEWSGLVPGLIGVYQVNLYVPGDRIRGDSLPVTLRIGGVESQKTGPAVPITAVQ